MSVPTSLCPRGAALLTCFCLAAAGVLTWGLDRALRPARVTTESSFRVTEAFYRGGGEDGGGSVGEPAPDFALPRLDGQQVVRLSEVLEAQPVVLLFGTLT